MEDKIKVKYDGRYLQAYMPNGDVIPQQTEIKIENNVGDKNRALVTLQVYADISELKDMSKPDIDYKSECARLDTVNSQLREEVNAVYKSAKFWETAHDRIEWKTHSYKLMFYSSLALLLFASIFLFSRL